MLAIISSLLLFYDSREGNYIIVAAGTGWLFFLLALSAVSSKWKIVVSIVFILFAIILGYTFGLGRSQYEFSWPVGLFWIVLNVLVALMVCLKSGSKNLKPRIQASKE